MIIPQDYAQANFRFTGQNAPTGAEVTLGLNVELYPGTPAGIAQDLGQLWVTHILPQQTLQITLQDVLVKLGPNATGPQAVYPVADAGNVSGGSENPNTSVLVSKVTGFGGRAGRGRMFVPGFHGDIFDSGGQMSSGNLAGIQNAFDDFYTDLVAAALVPTLLHSAGSPITAPILITSFAVQAKAATQRRRLRR